MPQVFASGTETAHHYKGNITPPKNYTIWRDFITQWTQHMVDRYGIDVVSDWKIEVWNEPNCGDWDYHAGCNCSMGKRYDDYIDFYGNTSVAIKSVSSKLQVGGPATAQLCWIDEFIEATEKLSLPLDFVSSHLYPTCKCINATEGVNAFYNNLAAAGDLLNKYNGKYKLYLSEFNSGLYGHTVNNHDDNFASSFMIFNAAKLQSLITKHNYAWLSYWAFSGTIWKKYVKK